jgi:nitroreductase
MTTPSDCIEIIKSRRSVRTFAPWDVTEEDLHAILETAFCAPSANNARPWHLVVVRDREVRARLADLHAYSGFVAGAPVVVTVCGDRQRSPDHWVEDCSAAAQNMLLAAHALGLASCWIGVRANDEAQQGFLRRVLELPEHIGVIALLPIGHPGSTPSPRPVIIPPSRLHFERFGRPQA